MKITTISKLGIGSFAFSLFLSIFSSCASRQAFSGSGELIGAPLASWSEPTPFGMVLIPRGNITLGHTQADSIWGSIADAKPISVDAFWMDSHEITNAQYRQFVYYVRDSIIRERLADPAYGGNPDYKITTDRYGDPIKPYLDWSKPLPNPKKAFDEELLAMNSVYYTHPITGEKSLDPAQLFFKYEKYDYHSAALYREQLIALRMPKEPSYKLEEDPAIPYISKDTAYIDDSGRIIQETLTRKLQNEYDFLNSYIVAIYPDEACWVKDFANSNNEQYTRLYFNHPDYDNYPVVGISWEQAEAFCAWRTRMFKNNLSLPEGISIEEFRLPTEAEWEYAARVGDSNRRYPWSESDLGNDNGCFYGNFKPDEGDYTSDGYLITSEVGSFSPNDFGLYDMAGNVAEWTSTIFSSSAYKEIDDLNPQLDYHATREDPLAMQLKVIRGGSWKDIARFIQSNVREKELQSAQRSYIGFRCVKSASSKNGTTPKRKKKR